MSLYLSFLYFIKEKMFSENNIEHKPFFFLLVDITILSHKHKHLLLIRATSKTWTYYSNIVFCMYLKSFISVTC
jgi:hypothetical protein